MADADTPSSPEISGTAIDTIVWSMNVIATANTMAASAVYFFDPESATVTHDTLKGQTRQGVAATHCRPSSLVTVTWKPAPANRAAVRAAISSERPGVGPRPQQANITPPGTSNRRTSANSASAGVVQNRFTLIE